MIRLTAIATFIVVGFIGAISKASFNSNTFPEERVMLHAESEELALAEELVAVSLSESALESEQDDGFSDYVSELIKLRELCPQLTNRVADTARLQQIYFSALEASEAFELDRHLLFAVMAVESRCKVFATSRRGAMGLMQLMPRTASWLGVRNSYGIRENIHGGAKYLSYLLERFEDDTRLALAAYNAGPASVERHGAVPPYGETQRYVRRVLRFYDLMQSVDLDVPA